MAAPMRRRSGARLSAVIASRSGRTTAAMFASFFGYAASSRAEIAFISARASPSVTPGFSRPIARR